MHDHTLFRRPAARLLPFILPIAVVLPGSVAAQDDAVVPTEPPPQEQPKPDRWRAAAELTLTEASGNQDVSMFTTAFTLEHLQRELFRLILKAQARYGRSEGDRVAENYRASLDLDLSPGARVAPFLHTSAERDPFKRLDLRMNSGAGARFRLYEKPDTGNLSISLGVLHSYETAAAAVNGTSQMARVNAQLHAMQKLTDDVTLTHQSEYQPVYGTIDDYLLTMNTSLRVLLTKRVALSISHEFDRDSRPAEEVRKDDRLLKAGVLIEL
jgi:putative salt-induced outer membrane protein YdiY